MEILGIISFLFILYLTTDLRLDRCRVW